MNDLPGPQLEELRDCFIDDDQLWFRLRSCLVVVRDGAVLMARNSRDEFHYSVGGGVHHGESTLEAARREALEETGVALEPRRLLFTHENFFPIGDRLAHEVAFYYLASDDPAIRTGEPTSATADGVEEWLEWLPLADWGSGRPAYPTILPEVLDELAERGDAYVPKVLVTRE